MNQSELHITLERLGMSQRTFAKACGQSPAAVCLWLSGKRPVPGWMDSWLEMRETLECHGLLP